MPRTRLRIAGVIARRGETQVATHIEAGKPVSGMLQIEADIAQIAACPHFGGGRKAEEQRVLREDTAAGADSGRLGGIAVHRGSGVNQ